MAREKGPEPDSTGQVPLWFLTYSDVITLLMTFFILLLTFSTSEPEHFERMQASLFGGGGATGIAGAPQGSMVLDAIAMRVRPSAGRATLRGSEMPPHYSDPELTSLSTGLSQLEQDNGFDPLESHRALSQMAMFLTDAGITPVGEQRLHMFAQQMKRGPYTTVLEVADNATALRVLVLAQHLVEKERVPAGRIAISVAPNAVGRSDVLGIRIVAHHKDEQ
jgi:hypothetical protein